MVSKRLLEALHLAAVTARLDAKGSAGREKLELIALAEHLEAQINSHKAAA